MFNLIKNIKVHFIGIGGIGMSGIAEILLAMGYKVSGSDISDGDNTKKLKSLGADIFIGHKFDNVKEATVVVYSSAINNENPEIIEAQRLKIPLVQRAEMLCEIMRLKLGISVAGSHGKTTTTSILATILNECNLDPTHVIGGVVENLKGHAKLGKSEYLVTEADESDGSFILLNSVMSVITNIDNDHLDFYKSEENIFKAFLDFANKVPFYGKVAINVMDLNSLRLITRLKKPFITFGLENNNYDGVVDYLAKDLDMFASKTTFSLFYRNKNVGRVELGMPGKHNVLNCLGAIAMAHQLDQTFEKIIPAISMFKGVARRYQLLYQNDNLKIIDDYGHHPSEIKKTIETAKSTFNSKIVVFFEPHRFSRTKNCWKDFAQCFSSADEVYISPIYPASEKPIEGITSENLVGNIDNAQFFPSLDNLSFKIKQYDNNTVILALGAGSIGKKIRQAIATFQ